MEARTVGTLFAAQCARQPDAVAVVCDSTVLTYRQLDIASDRVADALMAFGAGPERLVALLLPRSVAATVAMLGVVKAGAAYLPLDVTHPPARNLFAMRDTAAVAAIAPATGECQVGEYQVPEGCPVLEIELNTGRISADPPRGPGGAEAVIADNLLYAIYTSGSTGVPKAVAITHANLIAQVCDSGSLPIGPGDRMLNAAAPAFDATGLEIWGPLLHGACVVTLAGQFPTPREFAQLLSRHRIDIAWLTAGLFRLLAETDPGMFAGMRVLLTGGDIVSPVAARAVKQACPALRLFNAYGPTEVTILATAHEIGAADLNARRLPIGKALTGYQVFILDERLQPVPPGGEGELCVAGAGVARGYLNRPELTAERFPLCPSDPVGGTMYRTGDLARWNDDGSVDFLGRLDFQIKLRGYRIEAGEVEAALSAHPSVAESVVLAREIEGEKQLVAYATARGRPADAASLRHHLAERLPAFMVPSHFVRIDRFPLTENGKIDRVALPQPVMERGAVDPPGNEHEAFICKLFGQLTGYPVVGRNDNLFDLGGTSLSVLDLTVALGDYRGASLRMADVYDDPTPAGISARLWRVASWSPLVPIQRDGSRRPIFCIHPATGTAVKFQSLAMVLGRDQPVWGLEARGLEDPERAHGSVREMASIYRDAIRTVQPTGPYNVLGWSFGGTIAHEMTCQWEQEGETVERLVLLDSSVGSTGALDYHGEMRFSRSILARMAELDDAGRARRARLIAWSAAQRNLMPADTPPAWAERMLQQVLATQSALKVHTSSVCNADIVLFRADHPSEPSRDEIFEWAPYCRGTVRIEKLPSRHNVMLDPPFVESIAAVFR